MLNRNVTSVLIVQFLQAVRDETGVAGQTYKLVPIPIWYKLERLSDIIVLECIIAHHLYF